MEEPLLPELRFDAGIFTLILADVRTINEKFPASKKGYLTYGVCRKKHREIWVKYTRVNDEPLPDMETLGHEFCHFLWGDSGDSIDHIYKRKE